MTGIEYKEYLDKLDEIAVRSNVDANLIKTAFAKFVFRETNINFDINELTSSSKKVLDEKIEQISKAITLSYPDMDNFLKNLENMDDDKKAVFTTNFEIEVEQEEEMEK